MALSNRRIAWYNGGFLPEDEVRLPFRDRGFVYGDAVFDTTRTFRHRLFKPAQHVDRLYRSMRYLRIDAGMGPAELVRVTEEVLERNRHLLDPDDDYWVTQRVSRGVRPVDGEPSMQDGPTVIVECQPLPLRERAALFRDGIRVVTPSLRRTAPDALSPRAKTQNYLNLLLADQEVQALDPGAWAILLDAYGHLAEGLGSNIFLARDGELLTPRERFVLPGISRATVIELAAALAIPCREADLDGYDALTADEAFLTSTSLCICPIGRINGRAIEPHGPLTRRLTDAYRDLVGCDFVAQYLRRLT